MSIAFQYGGAGMMEMNVHALQALVRNFLLMNMSEVILNSSPPPQEIINNGVRTSAVQEVRVAKLFIAVVNL
jgi:hypothetical protein